MATITSRLEGLKKPLAQAGVPVMVLLILVMMLVPLPALLLDLLFTLNIGMAIMVLIAALNVKNFKDFVSFPTLLLITTLMRLSLNVASTRIVLLNGHSGTDAAGKVIVRANTTWAMIDKATGRLVRVRPEVSAPFMGVHH